MVEKFAYFKRGYLNIPVKSSKFLSSLLFCKRNIGLVVEDVVFLKEGFLDHKNDIFL